MLVYSFLSDKWIYQLNYLINMYHENFSALNIGKIQVFPFDRRLMYLWNYKALTHAV